MRQVRENRKTDQAFLSSPEEWEDLGLEVEDELVIHFKSR